jgi:hypothetical protein
MSNQASSELIRVMTTLLHFQTWKNYSAVALTRAKSFSLEMPSQLTKANRYNHLKTLQMAPKG